jgi:hypothetical protein
MVELELHISFIDESISMPLEQIVRESLVVQYLSSRARVEGGRVFGSYARLWAMCMYDTLDGWVDIRSEIM